MASKLGWTAETCVLFLIADYPCHGTEFHDMKEDNYPYGDPNDIDADQLLHRLKAQGIKFFFGKLTCHTDKMIARFNAICEDYITTTPMDHLTLIDVVTTSTTSSASSSLSASGRAEEGIAQRTVILDASLPAWETIKEEAALEYAMTMPDSMEAFLTEADDRCVQDLPTAVSIKIAGNPFAKGGQRAAFFGLLHELGQEVVIKESLAVKKKYRKKVDTERILVCHRAAKFLAQQFNGIRPDSCPAIDFVGASILQLNTRWPEQPFAICEGKICGDFEKFNSNTGYCAPCPSLLGTNHEAVQAFSHWTHCATNGRMMVVDCQGSRDPRINSFHLTDPAVHATNLLQFGKTNLGEEGFRRFFATHKCNTHCRALVLPAHQV